MPFSLTAHISPSPSRYRSSPTRADYTDPATLQLRVQDVARRLLRRHATLAGPSGAAAAAAPRGRGPAAITRAGLRCPSMAAL